MKHPQFTFDLSRSVDYSPSAFARSAANDAAAKLISEWPKWPASCVAIVGPRACGKSHLGTMWLGAAHGTRINLDDLSEDTIKEGLSDPLWIDGAGAENSFDETALFHALNLAKEEGGAILLTAREAPARWNVALPDLASRLKAVPIIDIGAPDDELIEAILTKRFSDVGLNADTAVMRFLLARIERSYSAVDAVAAAFAQRTLATHRQATVHLATEVLQELGISI